ncbi:MAG: hypothetical protein IJ305_00215, partial [Oscillospiraceae bacterium]|nr:hypothetical protein [Oscillospiraceae bacterium]
DSSKQLLHCHQRVLKDAKKKLNSSENIFRMFPSVFWLAVIIVGAVMALMGYNEYQEVAMNGNGFAKFMGGFAIAGVGGIVSIMRLFHWDSIGKFIGAFFINSLTIYIFGAVASIINLIRDRKKQNREIRENRSVVNDINRKIADLKSIMNT